ncbi:hypothetical protein PG994_006927 [Apiospora phragmitis]|uniref:Uncharacterized protein n=1 Tax=Apiospora phragmitis TaxID=2905665 RepID=A0ABR1VJ51_9PEZI
MSGVTSIHFGPFEAGPQATSHNGVFPDRSFFNLRSTTACDTPGCNEPCADTRELSVSDCNEKAV